MLAHTSSPAITTTSTLCCVDSSYSETEIIQAECYVLKTLDWNLSYPNLIHFLRRISEVDQYNIRTRTITKYLMEIQCLEWRLISVPPSVLTAASVGLARLILGGEDWTPNLAYYSIGTLLCHHIIIIEITDAPLWTPPNIPLTSGHPRNHILHSFL